MRRDIHFLNDDNMVACNPRDREAAHRAEVEPIATQNPRDVTCKKCLVALHRGEKTSELGEKPKHSIMELEGLGAEIWQGVDVDQYINEMRDEWDRKPESNP